MCVLPGQQPCVADSDEELCSPSDLPLPVCTAPTPNYTADTTDTSETADTPPPPPQDLLDTLRESGGALDEFTADSLSLTGATAGTASHSLMHAVSECGDTGETMSPQPTTGTTQTPDFALLYNVNERGSSSGRENTETQASSSAGCDEAFHTGEIMGTDASLTGTHDHSPDTPHTPYTPPAPANPTPLLTITPQTPVDTAASLPLTPHTPST